MGDRFGEQYDTKYVHIYSPLFVHWTDGRMVSLICCFSTFGWWVVFSGAVAFNADISKWQTGKVTAMHRSTSTSVPPFVHCLGLTCIFIVADFLLFLRFVVRSGGG